MLRSTAKMTAPKWMWRVYEADCFEGEFQITLCTCRSSQESCTQARRSMCGAAESFCTRCCAVRCRLMTNPSPTSSKRSRVRPVKAFSALELALVQFTVTYKFNQPLKHSLTHLSRARQSPCIPLLLCGSFSALMATLMSFGEVQRSTEILQAGSTSCPPTSRLVPGTSFPACCWLTL